MRRAYVVALLIGGVVLGQPAVPVGGKALLTSDGRVQVYWASVYGADRYEVAMQRVAPRPNVTVSTVVNNLIDASPNNGFAFYQVRSCDYVGRCSAWTPQFWVVTQALVPCPAPARGGLVGCLSASEGGPNLAVVPATGGGGVLVDLFGPWIPGLTVLSNMTAINYGSTVGKWAGYVPFSTGVYYWVIGGSGSLKLSVDGVVVFDPYSNVGGYYTVEVPMMGGWRLIEFTSALTPAVSVHLEYGAKQ